MTDRELILLHDLLEDLETDEGVCYKTRSSICATTCPLWYAGAFGDNICLPSVDREAVQEAADDATVQLRADMATQKALWLAVCSVADAYGFGPERMKKFFVALQENNDEITRMEKEVDTDYAYEKLRLKAERVTGMKIEYLYEHEAQEKQE